MTSARDKFQQLLRELFQFDCADLDFGIYRIINYKRDVIEKFISTDLPKTISDELDRGALADQSQTAEELTNIAGQITETLGKDALDADGNLAEAYHGTPLGKKYLELKSKAAGGRGREALETTIFNHLYTFFRRYYQDGDFISKRRYSKRQKYAIPYNGEEVYLHWANHDQYYVKTAEHFHDYTFTSYGVIVHFKLTTANIEQNNIKGDKRFFLPRVKEIEWDENAGELVIPFEYRPLTDQETVTYGTKNQQEKIISKAFEDIPQALSPKTQSEAVAAITAERHKNRDGQSVTFLEHHLRQYTRTNTSDFFIHKDLKGFLSHELDFYLKNEVLSLDEMEAAGEGRSEGWFQVLRVIKAVGSRIIEFLHQIESFQKMLWEKRKFITETQYCITVGTIDESFYSDIAACDAQWAEWKDLFHIDEEQIDLFTSGKSKRDRRIMFLKAHPNLVVDTSHCEEQLTDRLLGDFNKLHGLCDGLLIHGDNFQALGLLHASYRESVKCIYIDPPYNTDASPIIYKNGYRHASWISLIVDRARAASRLKTSNAVMCVAIDDYEYPHLALCLESILPVHYLATVAARSKPQGRPTATGFSANHEYAVFWGDRDAFVGRLPREGSKAHRYPHSDERGIYAWANLRKSGTDSDHKDRPKSYYPIYVSGDALRVPNMTWDSKAEKWIIEDHPTADEDTVWPLDSNRNEKVWTCSADRLRFEMDDVKITYKANGEIELHKKYRPNQEGALPGTWWDKPEYSASESGTKLLKDLFGGKDFDFPKSVHLVEDNLRVAGLSPGMTVLDYFGGSGTTGEATIRLNRDDGGHRRFILVEMGEYFDTVLLPRVKKVTFAPAWKNGKPKSSATADDMARGPRIVKYMRIESYEDALNNISFDDAYGQGAFQFDDYLLKYMLKWETRKSQTLLNIGQLTKPFSYKLTVAKGDETIEQLVDLPETFNYLLGLHVTTRKVYDDDGRRYLVYNGRIDHRRIAVIWRETEGWQKKELERDKKFVQEQKLTEGVEEVFVNGDSFIPNAKALEPVFKARMFSAVEA
ncbi:MAG: site-specific DNA-methyltransferase [Deltaproteobacteria bacterium]|nr:site-specific DNA-methyltransferase [Deltaproteobacteria bacterium]